MPRGKMSPLLPGDVAINNVKLIKEIELRPCLYNKSVKEYSNLMLKKKVWDDVCMNVLHKHYNKWNKVQKHRAVLALQKRWSNLRTSFIRDMKKKHDLDQDDVRKYRYFNHMYFLLGTGISPETYGFGIDNIPKPSPGDWNDDDDDDDDEEKGDQDCDDNEAEQVEYLEDDEFTPIKTEQSNQEDSDDEFEPRLPPPTPRIKSKKRESQVVYEEVMLDPLQYARGQKPEVVDQDVNFCMSLAPMFKSMPQSKKLKVQIEILKIFDKVNDGAF